jgi:hypothetical protein
MGRSDEDRAVKPLSAIIRVFRPFGVSLKTVVLQPVRNTKQWSTPVITAVKLRDAAFNIGDSGNDGEFFTS